VSVGQFLKQKAQVNMNEERDRRSAVRHQGWLEHVNRCQRMNGVNAETSTAADCPR
jgi:hypothetical protein